MKKDVNRHDTNLRHSKTLILPQDIDFDSSCFKLVQGNGKGKVQVKVERFFLGKQNIL